MLRRPCRSDIRSSRWRTVRSPSRGRLNKLVIPDLIFFFAFSSADPAARCFISPNTTLNTIEFGALIIAGAMCYTALS